MTLNPIDEIKQIRHRLGAESGFDVHRIFEQLREQQSASDRTYITISDSHIADDKTMHPSGDGRRDSKSESRSGSSID